jgi:AcrR family transcriptional regulator
MIDTPLRNTAECLDVCRFANALPVRHVRMLGVMVAVSESPIPSTPPAPMRERRKAKARVEIARVALRLFEDNGYEATTVGDIAAAADYSVRSFYRYFTSKEDLVFFDIEFLLEDVREAINAADPGTSLWPVIRGNVVDCISRFQDTDGEFAAQVLRAWMTDPALAGPFFRFCDRWHQLIADGWSAAHGSGDPATDLRAQQIAHYVVSTCQACFQVHVHTGQDLCGLLDEAFDRFEHGLDSFGDTRTGSSRDPVRVPTRQ